MGEFVLIPESKRVVWSALLFFFISVPAPSPSFAENIEVFASSVAAIVMSAFVRQVRILALVQLGVCVLILELENVPVAAVPVPVE